MKVNVGLTLFFRGCSLGCLVFCTNHIFVRFPALRFVYSCQISSRVQLAFISTLAHNRTI